MANHPQYARMIVFCAALSLMITSLALAVRAQKEDPQVLKIRAKSLVEELKLTEALPIYEKLVVALPNDPEIHYYYALSLIAQANNTPDEAAARALRVKARNAFLRAQQLGDNSILLKGFIEGMPEDGSAGAGFSDNAEADRLMDKAEAAFSSGKLDDALALYQSALKADPRCYHAALFSGDVYLQKGNFTDATTWYKRAIAIDPNRETAYRYSATPLMKQGKYDQARDLYVEAFITEPYSRMAVSGMVQWAETTKTRVGHPKIDVPQITIGSDGKASSTVNINPLADDGSMAWMSYVTTRELWRKGNFAKTFPKETEYRHSLQEEADALRSVVKAAKELKPKTLNSQIATLAALDQDGVLEAFILMAIPDNGIAQDHRAYLIANRAKLRQYVLKYVIAS